MKKYIYVLICTLSLSVFSLFLVNNTVDAGEGTGKCSITITTKNTANNPAQPTGDCKGFITGSFLDSEWGDQFSIDGSYSGLVNNGQKVTFFLPPTAGDYYNYELTVKTVYLEEPKEEEPPKEEPKEPEPEKEEPKPTPKPKEPKPTPKEEPKDEIIEEPKTTTPKESTKPKNESSNTNSSKKDSTTSTNNNDETDEIIIKKSENGKDIPTKEKESNVSVTDKDSKNNNEDIKSNLSKSDNSNTINEASTTIHEDDSSKPKNNDNSKKEGLLSKASIIAIAIVTLAATIFGMMFAWIPSVNHAVTSNFKKLIDLLKNIRK